jgi:hypothetical protein
MDGADMKPRSVRFAPPIPTAATRSLELSITRLARRRPDIRATIDAIRGGDDEALLGLVHEARAGHSDAAAIAIWSLLPRLCAVIRSRMATPDWRSAVDDYIGIAYLTIREVKENEGADFLADKVVARVRRRHERVVAADRRFAEHLSKPPQTTSLDWRSADVPVEDHALIRARLQTLRAAATSDPSVRADVHIVVSTMLQSDRVPGPRRMAVLRSRRRLSLYLDDAA